MIMYYEDVSIVNVSLCMTMNYTHLKNSSLMRCLIDQLFDFLSFGKPHIFI